MKSYAEAFRSSFLFSDANQNCVDTSKPYQRGVILKSALISAIFHGISVYAIWLIVTSVPAEFGYEIFSITIAFITVSNEVLEKRALRTGDDSRVSEQ
jgi:hypothetical protein